MQALVLRIYNANTQTFDEMRFENPEHLHFIVEMDTDDGTRLHAASFSTYVNDFPQETEEGVAFYANDDLPHIADADWSDWHAAPEDYEVGFNISRTLDKE